MPKDKTNPTEKQPRKPRVQSPEITAAKQECLEKRSAVETECSAIMKAARKAAKLRKLTEHMSEEEKAAFKASL